MKRIVQRTPHLGLRIRLQPLADAPPPAPASDRGEPTIGPARWRNPGTGKYDLETLAGTSDFYTPGVFVDGARQLVFTAAVTGDLDGCTVGWEVVDELDLLSVPEVVWHLPDRALAVAIANEPYRPIKGVLTATATVTLPDGQKRPRAPIYLVVSDGY